MRGPLYQRIPWTPLAIAVAVILSGAFAVPSIRDAASLADVPEAMLALPLGYVILAPLSNVLDMLTLLSARQHIAFLIGVLVCFAAWRIVVARFGTSPRHLRPTAMFALGLVLTYVATAILPRPMAALVTDNADIVKIDFHSHTAASHDGRPGWSVEDNRAWHRDGGYDVAFITDHATVVAAERGVARNSYPAGEAVTLLQGIEVTWAGEHVNILGAQRRYKGILTDNLRDVDEQSLQLASLISGREPVVIWNHPHRLNRLPTASRPGTSGVRGIEISNGAPDSMDEVRLERAAIAALAQRRNLALTSGSDNHGWGSTVPNWTLMLIFGWRGMAADSLESQIEDDIRRGGVRAGRVVERRAAQATSDVELALTVFAAPARMLTTLSNDERISWLIWISLITAATWWIRRARARRAA